MAIDQGTTSTRAAVVDSTGRVVAWSRRGLSQIYPRPSWVEHDALEIWNSVKAVMREAVAKSGIDPADLRAVGIANQRETVVVWDPSTGKPLLNAIVWQDRRAAPVVDELAVNHWDEVRRRTGLIPDPYFTGPKVMWLLGNVQGLRGRAERGEALFGTIDSWIIWNLTRGGSELVNERGGGSHVTDYSNASRTMLFNIRRLEWDGELLQLMGSPPPHSLPLPVPSGSMFGFTGPEASELLGRSVPVAAALGDQQAALLGQACTVRGCAKATYGTGTFILMNTGGDIIESRRGLISTVFYSTRPGSAAYALEGSMFAGGAAMQWLMDIGAAKSPSHAEELARQVGDNGGVYLVPAFAGLGAPYWDRYARGLLIGLTRSSDARYLARAVLESIAYMARDVLESLAEDSGAALGELRVDGGASSSDFLMQLQADVAGIDLLRPVNVETTVLGAAYLAGLSVGAWGMDDIASMWSLDKRFKPSMPRDERDRLYEAWRDAVARAAGWARRVPWAA